MSEAYSVIYSPEALNDLREIFTYIAFHLKAPGTAKKQTDRIRKEIRSLTSMPRRYAPVDWEPWQGMGLRRMPVDRFVVFYLPDTELKTVTVIRIVYGGRDAETILRPETE